MRAVVIWVLMLGGIGALAGQFPSLPQSSPGPLLKAGEGATAQSAAPQTPNTPQFNSQDGSITLDRQADGHFYADVRINNSSVHMLIDTGASAIALSREDARNSGLATSIGMNDVVGEGADGAIHGEFVRLEKVELGPLTASGLDAVILSSGEQSLLGQSFLRKFASVQIEGDRMVLR